LHFAADVGILHLMKKGLVALGVVIGVVVILGVMLVSSYNNFVGLSQATDKAWAQVQNVYQRRADLIPNLVKTVEGAANFEKSTLMEVTQARANVGKVQVNANTAPNAADLQKFQQAQDQLSSALSRLLVVVERYPELKANSNFQNLQAQLEGTENRIAVERGRFNEVVQAYNTAIARFPGVLLAGLFHFQPKEYFKAQAGAETVPNVQFNFGSPTNK
jgi:LemA protein